MSTVVGRLKRRAEFVRVATRGQKLAVPGMVVQMAATPREDGHPDASPAASRIGITVTRRVGTAVVRNRARRRLRAVAREVLPEAARRGYDYVLIGRKATLTRRYTDLVRDLTVALRRLHGEPSRP
jgi:ribonuclease P protein component